jgi:predicted ATPase with chaperone activity
MARNHCPACNTKTDEEKCPKCGAKIPALAEQEVSVLDDNLDSMVQQASIPSLATLFRAGKDAGLIKPITVYGESPTGA